MYKTPVDLGEPIKSISLDLTEGCSLRCKYCFADLAAHKKAEKWKLNEDTMEAVVDWLFDDSTSGNAKKMDNEPINIEFWGGEPLHNWDMLVKAVEYSEKKSEETGKPVHFGGTTNVVEITEERLKYFQDHNIHFLMSIDGVKESHDKFRVYPDGSGSWDAINGKLDMILDYMPHWQARISLHPDNLDLLYESFEYFLSKGIYSAFYSPVYEAKWTEENWKTYKDQVLKIIKRQIREAKMGRKLDVKFIDDMVQYVLNIKRKNINLDNPQLSPEELAQLSPGNHAIQPCGAGQRYVGISIDGQIYVCHRFNKHNMHHIEPNKKYGWLGDVWTGIQNLELYDYLKNWDVDNIEHCKNCPVRYNCKGGCYGANYDLSNKIDGELPDQCKFELANFDLAYEAIELWNNAGMYDERQKQIIIPNRQSNLPPINVDRCFCHNGIYSIPDYMSGKEKNGISVEETVLGMAQQVIGKALAEIGELQHQGQDPFKTSKMDEKSFNEN